MENKLKEQIKEDVDSLLSTYEVNRSKKLVAALEQLKELVNDGNVTDACKVFCSDIAFKAILTNQKYVTRAEAHDRIFYNLASWNKGLV